MCPAHLLSNLDFGIAQERISAGENLDSISVAIFVVTLISGIATATFVKFQLPKAYLSA